MNQGRHFVYVFAKGDEDEFFAPVKVGLAGNPTARLREVQTSCPFPIVLAVAFETHSRSFARALERTFHKVNSSDRLHGEWFNLTPAMAIASLCLGYRVGCEKIAPSSAVIQKALECSGVIDAEKLLGIYPALAESLKVSAHTQVGMPR